MPKKKHSRAKKKMVLPKPLPLFHIESGTLEEFAYYLHQATTQGYRIMEGSISHHTDSYFQSHSCIIYKPLLVKEAKK